MNLSTSQRALWAIALGSILTLGAALPAAARDDVRERSDGEHARGPAAAKDKARERRDGDAPKVHRAGIAHPAAAQRDVERARTVRAVPRQQVMPRVDSRASQARQQALRNDQARDRMAANQRASFERARVTEPRQAAANHRVAQLQQAQRREQAVRLQQQADSRRDALRTHGRDWPQRRNDSRHDDAPRQSHARVDTRQRDQYIREDRQRAERYRQSQVQRYQIAAQRARILEQQQRMAQYRYEQQYLQRLRQQQARWNAHRYDPWQDQYYLTPASYRYSYGGSYRQTNRYGADLMRQAVNYGYEEGVRAGRADREDGWRADYRGNYGYQDASYGYNGYYVDQDVYNHYFRQGFERGYEDGYSTRYRHGRRNGGGDYAILGTVLAVILGLQLID